eukprot:CAMPEP_0116836990 /NCGR_PEP_ID=MMETSP0418-20121206/8408_1 /TAXON_ID=1158023 /ORGANISM="Astrosyne radiata, Strain 13vi08-1A" /LENGTH=459 /DNA_ID=CAMNT_0004466831 /DNA_START=1 /DNA_END=1380 /DNA_ORIENTATION=+
MWSILLPRMCLNRFYLAQGVRLYAQETWRLVFEGDHGLEMVQTYLQPICRFYVQMCDADNHVVREAACQAIAELVRKVKPLSHHNITSLLQALIICFHDESWPVRDEACLATGMVCMEYPKECKDELPLLKERWMEQLTDPIASVRADAAVAIANAVTAYPNEFKQEIVQYLQNHFNDAKKQPTMTKKAQKELENNIEAHSNSQLYSCGSLAPKLKKAPPGAGRIGGCSSCIVNRPKQPWETTDGCIGLFSQMIQRGFFGKDDALFTSLMQQMADVCRVRHFPQANDLRCTLWNHLPDMAEALGKRRFKGLYLEMFLELLMQNLDPSHNTFSALSVHAAAACAESLSRLVGPMIFRGRLQNDSQRDIFDRAMRERNLQNAQRPPAGFSPFEPPLPSTMRMNPNGHHSQVASAWNPHPRVAANDVNPVVGSVAWNGHSAAPAVVVNGQYPTAGLAPTMSL